MVSEVITKRTPFLVQAIKDAVQRVSVTGKTALSVRSDIRSDNRFTVLTIFARKYFGAIETGRGPIKSNTYGGFDKSLLEWMDARGIGTDLPPKKREQLARFLAYKINKEGDELFKSGGRQVYSDIIRKFIAELTKELAKDQVNEFRITIRSAMNIHLQT